MPTLLQYSSPAAAAFSSHSLQLIRSITSISPPPPCSLAALSLFCRRPSNPLTGNFLFSRMEGVLHCMFWAYSVVLITSTGTHSALCNDEDRPFTCPSLLISEFQSIAISEATSSNPVK
ncbi:hypothetical protein CRG98_012983, partial [Punica granatum]